MATVGYINRLLKKREDDNHQVKVAVFGAGWYGQGLVQELYRCPGLMPKIIFDRDVNSGVETFINAGVPKNEIVTVATSQEIQNELKSGKYIATSNNDLFHELNGIDAFYDATGNIVAGAHASKIIIDQGIHFLTVSAELDSTIGFVINKMAQEKGVVFSDSDGDQPGVLIRMVEYVKLMGFEIIVAGNCKGFMDFHKTPKDILPWVRPGHNPKMVTAFTDGTKQSTELTVLANATELAPDIRGMHGPNTTKDTLVEDFQKVISREGIVDYVLGIDGVNQGGGVFIVGKREGNRVEADMEYLKKGKGPYYLFFKEEHMCYFVSTTTIAEAALLNVPTLAPVNHVADVITVAKRDLKKGEKLDGMGGYTAYGIIDKAEVARKENLLPMGLAENCFLTCDVAKDTPLSYDMVDFEEDNAALALRREQDRLFLKKEAVGT